MKTSGVPIQLGSIPIQVEPVSAMPAGTTQLGADFVDMLMQMLGGAAPAAATATALPGIFGKAELREGTDAESEDLSKLAAMLAIPVPAAVPLAWAALPAGVSAAGADPMELLGLGTAAGKSSAETLLTLQTTLAEAGADPALDAGGGTNDGTAAVNPFGEVLQPRVAHAESLVSRSLHTPVGTPQWADELGTQLTWMMDRGQQAASLRLSPEHLGPLEVRISITDDKASVWFGAAHADTRAAIEHALPRLREMFSAQGLSLADAGVFREPPRDQQASTPRSLSGHARAGETEGEVMTGTRGIGLLDAYA